MDLFTAIANMPYSDPTFRMRWESFWDRRPDTCRNEFTHKDKNAESVLSILTFFVSHIGYDRRLAPGNPYEPFVVPALVTRQKKFKVTVPLAGVTSGEQVSIRTRDGPLGLVGVTVPPGKGPGDTFEIMVDE